MPPSFLSRLKRGLAKPPRVMIVRGLQEAHLSLLERSKGWVSLDRSARARWTRAAAVRLAQDHPFAVFASDGLDAIRRAIDDGRLDKARLAESARRIADRDFQILGVPVPRTGGWPWRRDWRFDHEWPKAPWTRFSHYGRRDVPYDVKYPWELGRLQFLLPLLQAAAVHPGTDYIERAISLLSDWSADNPYAHSVNWSPMEASMRTLTLVMALDLARAAHATPEQQMLFLYEIERNAAFVWRTIEDTDVRGNHYTANLAALMTAGAALSPLAPEALKWFRYAAKRMNEEIILQYLPDGVNFEKATYYHRLTTDLFLVMAVIGARRGAILSEPARERLRRACHFIADYIRPNGAAPLIGDSDDAMVFAIDDLPISDHRATLALGAALFDDDALRQAAGGVQPSTLWLLGNAAGVDRVAAPSDRGSQFYADGGFAIVRAGGNQLIVDVGEVGLKGRGGHGHNDILGFELSLGGMPIIVDAGSYVYSGDLAARDRFRSSRAHNALVLDGKEIAPLGPEPFRASSIAVPTPAAMTPEGDVWTITGGHLGYRRLAHPATHFRSFRFDVARGRLEIADRVESVGPHESERFLHFSPQARVELADAFALATVAEVRMKITWDRSTMATLEDGEISEDYGRKTAAPVLHLRDRLTAGGNLSLTIERV